MHHNGWIAGAALGAATMAVLMALVTLVIRAKIVPMHQTDRRGEPMRSQEEAAWRYLKASEPKLALVAFLRCDESPEVLTGRGQARWLAYLQDRRDNRQPLDENHPDVVAARHDLQAAMTPEADLWLGLIHEAFNQWQAARQVYRFAGARFPNEHLWFTTAIRRLDILEASVANEGADRSDPAQDRDEHRQITNESSKGRRPKEAGFAFWEALAAWQRGDLDSAQASLLQARDDYLQQRDVLATSGQRRSDPRGDIFPCCCDQMLAYWRLAAQLRAMAQSKQSLSEVVRELVQTRDDAQKAKQAAATALGCGTEVDLWTLVARLITQRDETASQRREVERELIRHRQDTEQRTREWTQIQTRLEAEIRAATNREAAIKSAWQQAEAHRREAESRLQGIREVLWRARIVPTTSSDEELVEVLESIVARRIDDKDREIARLRRLLVPAKRQPSSQDRKLASVDPREAERVFLEGVQQYLHNRWSEAEESFLMAIRLQERDARFHYFLGLARHAQGHTELAEADFRRGAALERQGAIHRESFLALIERLQGPARSALSRYRP
jgi:TolA-binding protein